MRKYEITFIVRPDLEEANINSIADSMKKALTDNNAKIVEEKAMGQRELAYEINKYNNGFYFFYVVETDNVKAIDEFTRLATISEDIIRHLIIKIED